MYSPSPTTIWIERTTVESHTEQSCAEPAQHCMLVSDLTGFFWNTTWTINMTMQIKLTTCLTMIFEKMLSPFEGTGSGRVKGSSRLGASLGLRFVETHTGATRMPHLKNTQNNCESAWFKLLDEELPFEIAPIATLESKMNKTRKSR